MTELGPGENHAVLWRRIENGSTHDMVKKTRRYMFSMKICISDGGKLQQRDKAQSTDVVLYKAYRCIKNEMSKWHRNK